MAALAWRGSYYEDDFLNLGLAGEGRLGRRYLLKSVFGHLEPGFRLLNYGLARVPHDYHLALLLGVACYATTLVFFYRILDSLSSSRWMNLVLTFGLGASALWLTSIFWSATALEVLPALAAILIATDAYLRHCRSGRWRHLALMALTYVVALTFYEKAALLLIQLPLLSVVLEPRRPSIVEILALARRRALAWLTLLGITGAYAIFYILGHYGAITGRPSFSQVAGAFAVFWSQGFVPGLLGGPLVWGVSTCCSAIAYSRPPLAFALIAQFLIAGLIVASVVVRPKAWRAWAFFTVITICSFGLVVLGRVVGFGIDIGRDTRYFVDVSPVFWLALAIAVLPSRPGLASGIPDELPGVDSPPRLPLLGARRWVPFALAAMVGVRIGIFIVSAVGPSDAWALNPWVAFARNVSRTLPAASAAGPATLYDDVVPVRVILDFIFPYNRLSNVLAIAQPGRVKVTDTGSPPYYVRSDGSVAPARFNPVADVLARPPSALTLNGFAASTAGELCAPSPGGSIVAGLDPALPVKTWFARFHYRAENPFTFDLLQVEPDGNQLAIAWSLPPGEHDAMVPFTARRIETIGLIFSSPARACVSSFSVGRPVDAEPPP